MVRKLKRRQGSAIYAQRKVIVEPVIGQTTEVRGMKRFLLLALENVSGEWQLIVATHNLLKLFRYRRSLHQLMVGARDEGGEPW